MVRFRKGDVKVAAGGIDYSGHLVEDRVWKADGVVVCCSNMM